MLERSVLAVPASNPRMIEKAVASEADVVFLDLEDAVVPSQKVESRQNVVRALTELDWGRKGRAYRVNAVSTPFFYRDVIDVVEQVGDRLDLLIVPKVERPEDLAALDILLTGIDLNLGFAPGKIAVEAQIENAPGLVQSERIAEGARLRALVFGPGDFSASVRMPLASIGTRDWWDEQYPGHRLHYPMSRIVVAARAAGVRAIDGPMADFRDLEGLRQACILARGLGYDGKWCIHPGQISVVNEVFLPTAEEIAWARRVMEAYDQAADQGRGAITVGETMVDAASIRMARTTLDLVREVGAI